MSKRLLLVLVLLVAFALLSVAICFFGPATRGRSITWIDVVRDLPPSFRFAPFHPGIVSDRDHAMKSSLILLIAATFGPSIQAQSPARTNSSAPSQPPACVSPEFRQFDFWLGKWKVIGPQGKQAGTSEITRVSEGCALREQWTAASGKGGMSINYYDSADREWHQDWVGGDGTILHLHGGLKEGAMVLDGTARSPKGPYLSRITWTPLEGGKVKQEWSISTDNGATWKPSFVGIYEKLL